MKKFLLAIAASTVAISGFALDYRDIEKSVQLKDGSTVHVFKDGKMAMENQYGRVVQMANAEVMETRDGQKITMQGNEVARLSLAFWQHARP